LIAKKLAHTLISLRANQSPATFTESILNPMLKVGRTRTQPARDRMKRPRVQERFVF
jgi:hypothetical protein